MQEAAMRFDGAQSGERWTVISNGRCEVHAILEYRGMLVNNWRARCPANRVEWLRGYWLPLKLSGTVLLWLAKNWKLVQAKERAVDEMLALGILPPDPDEMARYEKS